MSKKNQILSEQTLLKDVCNLIDQAKSQLNRQANAILIMLYWAIGQRINEDILKDARAEYGKQGINQLSERLHALHGRGYLESLAGQPFKSESNFEQAILDDIENFLLSMGNSFAFLERQKPIEIDGEFYRIDLLMYNRRLHCLVVIELKMGKFKAQDKGQIELYLRWLEKNEMQSGENPPIGIILCSEKSDETVELLKLEDNGIRVCQFLTELPPKEIFIERLHNAIRRARERQEQYDLLDKLDSSKKDI